MKNCVISSLMVVGLAFPAMAEDYRDQEIADLRSMVESLKGEVDVLRAENSDQWLSEERSEQIRGLVQDVLADADTRASLQGDSATSGYKKGFFIQSADGNWKLKLNGQLQIRWTFNHAKNGPNERASDEYGFAVRRAKLKFSGNVIDPSWTYKFTLVNERGGKGQTQGSNGNTYAEDLWIQKSMENDTYLKVGQFKAPYLREELVSSSKQLTVERSMINNQFTYGWAQGIELGMKNDTMWGRVWYGDGPNSLNRTFNNDSTNSLVARMDYLLAGDWKAWGTMTGYGITEDYASIGAALEWFNQSHNRGSGADYGGMDAPRSYGFTIDVAAGGNGWTAFTYFTMTEGKSGDTKGRAYGWVAQGGVDVAEDMQLFGRYELGDIKDYQPVTGVEAQAAASGYRNGHDSTLTVGVNYWPGGSKTVKFSADFGYAFSFLNDSGDGPWNADYTSSGNGWRGDANGAKGGQWLIRSQMQLVF
ncbi:MAG: OprO/OprP family phosphate-selective porin [Phycisphaerales bacterium]|nr:OprO/OprP family phosphate-selective porin [Phycisphaerales bacterium]